MAAKICWLREHGVAAARFHQPVSYLVARWTGASVLDPAHASTTMLYDLAAGAWSRELLDAFAIDPGELPDLRPTCTIAGPLARPLGGILAGVPVAVGTGDDFATPLGAGLAAPGRIACVLGTAEVVGAISTARVLDVPAARAESDPWRALAEPMVETHAYPTGAYFVENPGWLSGGAVRWAVRMLGLADDRELDTLAASAPPGADGLTFVPALTGAMTPVWRPDARGALHGLSAAHGPAHVARAVLEGLAFACRDVVERLAALGLPAGEILALGGGANSRTWLQLRADVLGRPHHACTRSDTCAIGAAMIAAVAAGALPDLATAVTLAPAPAEVYEPRGDLAEAYARYRELVGRGCEPHR
jgi:xylulokinase